MHVIFSTKNREALLVDEELRKDLYDYIGGVCRNNECVSFRVGGYHDHIHILCCLSRTKAVSELIKEIKRVSSHWLSTEKGVADFSWQAGYGVFSVSQSHVDSVVEYIDNQKTHHQTLTFKEEYVKFLEKYKIQYDERYLWD